MVVSHRQEACSTNVCPDITVIYTATYGFSEIAAASSKDTASSDNSALPVKER